MSNEDFKMSYQQLAGFDSDRLVLMVKDPRCLYAYWDISDNVREKYVKEFANDIWQRSTAALKITNVSQNSSFTININDAMDSTYINVPSSSSLYCVELGRLTSDNYFISILKSNYVVTPTDNISSNSAAFFIDCMTMNEDWQFALLENSYDYYFQDQLNDFLGISSTQLTENFDSISGLSSIQLIKISGLSSEQFIGNFNNILGLSSEQLIGNFNNIFGLSSEQLIGNIKNILGLSSEQLMRNFNNILGLSSEQLIGNFNNIAGLSSEMLIEKSSNISGLSFEQLAGNIKDYTGISSYSYFTEDGKYFE